MRSMRTVAVIGMAVALAGCPADQQAIDPPGGPPGDLSPDPRIEAAPAYPTPPGEVPIGLQPDTGARPTVDMDTIRQMDTIRGAGATGTQAPGTATGATPPR